MVENALRYTPAGGTVDVEARLHDGRAELRVTDSGPGIATAEHERVFDRSTAATRLLARRVTLVAAAWAWRSSRPSPSATVPA